MRFFVRLREKAKRHRRQFVAALLVLSLLCASIGLPIWVEPVKDLSQAFPCMHHRCGCLSAEACWRSCCCMTAAQKLAWAEKNGVTPPAYALQAMRAASVAAKSNACGGGCCQKAEAAATPVAQASTVDESLPAGGFSIVLTSQHRHCQGLTALWLILGQALPQAEEAAPVTFDRAAGEWVRVVSQPSAESRALAPAEPPPWPAADVA